MDAVAKDAGVTSSAFYANFGSKAEIFRAALEVGLGELRDGIGTYRRRHDKRWLRRFATWYLGAQRRGDLAGSCALPTLSLEAARADVATRESYNEHLRAVMLELQAGLEGTRREDDAWAILALLSGGMTMAHAVSGPSLGRALQSPLSRVSSRWASGRRRDAVTEDAPDRGEIVRKHVSVFASDRAAVHECRRMFMGGIFVSIAR